MSIILMLLATILGFLSLSFLIFAVRTYILAPLFSLSMRKFTPQDHWLTTRGILDAQVRLEKKRWYISRNRTFFYLDIPTYHADVSITFLVNNNSYIIHPPMPFGDEVGSIFQYRAAEIVAKYPAGKTVVVLYDPNNPQHAVAARRT
jgi:hypothetical protein